MSWYNYSYRHSLAAKGIKTSLLSKKSQLIDLKHHSTLQRSGAPTSAQVDVIFKRLQGLGDVTLEEDPLDKLSDDELKARLKRDFSDFQTRAEEIEALEKMRDARQAAKRQLEEDILSDEHFAPYHYFENEENLEKDEDEGVGAAPFITGDGYK